MKKQAPLFKPLRKAKASEEQIKGMTGKESWEEIQRMDGFRHFLLWNPQEQAYLGGVKNVQEGRAVLWEEVGALARAFVTLESARNMVRRLSENPDFRQIPLVIGALVETETQYRVLFRTPPKEGEDSIEAAS